MKKLFFIIMLFPMFLSAQQTWTIDTKDSKVGQSVQGKQNVSDKQKTFQEKKYTLTSGEYLKQAGTCYLVGAGISIIGSVVAISDLNNEEGDNTRLIAGGAIGIAGYILTIVAHTKLIKAGIALDEERKVSLHPSSTGIGLALKF